MDRQKILMIFGGAFVAALVLTFLLFRLTQAPKAEEMASVVAAEHSMPAGTKLAKGDVRLIRMLKKDVPAGARWGGIPAQSIRSWLREVAWLNKMAQRREGRQE